MYLSLPVQIPAHNPIFKNHDIGFLTNYGIKKHKKKITCKNLGQERYCLTNGIFNNPVPLQSCGCQINLLALEFDI
jgi:hypothetical protein